MTHLKKHLNPGAAVPWRRLVGLSLCAAVLAACGGGDSGGGATTPTAPTATPAVSTMGVADLAPDGVEADAQVLAAEDLPPGTNSTSGVDAVDMPPSS